MRISDWSSDVCSSDLRRFPVSKCFTIMPRCLAFTGTFPMTIKIDLANQVRQTILPRWKPLLPLFEAVMNSFQAIKDAELPANISGQVTIEEIGRAHV